MKKKEKFLLSDSNWLPGYFSNKTVSFIALLETEEVQNFLKDAPEKSKILGRPKKVSKK